MVREALIRLRTALDDGPQPYEHLDAKMATKLCGAFYLIGIVYAAIVFPLSPPDGPLGVVGVAACMVAAAAIGLYLLRRPEPAGPNLLLALCYSAVIAIVLYRAAAGAGSPFHQLLLLAIGYTSVVHPARRAAGVLLAASLAAVSPIVYEEVAGEFAAVTTSHLAMTWSLSLVILIWATKMRRERSESAEAREEAERHARIDSLTALGNRRAMEEALPAAVADARRHGEPLSVLVADLDDFKSINDEYGHQAGDAALRAAARAFTSAVRVPDPCFRWGGDEFVAILPRTDLAEAREIAARVQSTVARACVRPDGRPLRITAGVAVLGDGETGSEAVARADAALLEARAALRSGVVG